MKHLVLFEQFQSTPPTTVSATAMFQWMPYDKEKDNPIQKSMPEDEVTIDELFKIITEAEQKGTAKDLQNAGLFMSHEKTPGGFTRTVTHSLDPLLFDVAIFDENYEEKSSFEKIDPKDVDIKKVAKGASILMRGGAFDDPLGFKVVDAPTS